MKRCEYAEQEGHHVKEDNRLTEVVYVECEGCGVICSDLTDWACLHDSEHNVWYYLCPSCQEVEL